MLEDIWGGVSDFLGDGLSSLLESILNATIFKLCYYLEKALCWIIGVLMDLFEVFAGLEPVTYNGQQDYLINVFFSNKAISNIYWGMAIIGMVLIFVFTIWSVIRKLFDLEGKQQQSMGQIIWSAVRSLFLIVGLTLVVSVVLNATGILMRQIDYIFNNAYHLDQPQEREFTEEEYAAMGRVLATIGNYSMVPNSNNRYNINLCFNDIRGDMYLLQEMGVFDYSYSSTDDYGNKQQSWQSVLSQIAKSADLRRDVSIDVYHEGIARSITAAMDYLQTNGNPVPVSKAEHNYVISERTHLDRMVFLLGTFRAAKNDAYNKNPSFKDALRGPYFYEDDRSINNFDQVNEDFNIGFETDYILVWFAAIALIFNLVVIILNCVARIFNMLLLYIIAPPFIASAPLDNGGKFRQWTIAFTIQSLSVFGTVIAMQLMLIYLPIVASPDLVLFKDRPLLNAIAQFMLVYGGSEAAKKAGSLVTGILADQAGMEAIRSGDMSGAASRVINKASGVATGALGVAAGVAGFALSPVTNVVKRPFKAAGDWWRKLGSGEGQARAEKSVQDEIAKNKAIEKHKKDHPEDAKYLPGGGGGGGSETSSNPKPETKPPEKQNTNPTNPTNPGNPGGQNPAPKQPPPIPKKNRNAPKSFEAEDARRSNPKPGGRVADIRERSGLDGGSGARQPAREYDAGGNRPNLNSPPPAPRNNTNGGANQNPNPPAGGGGQQEAPREIRGNDQPPRQVNNNQPPREAQEPQQRNELPQQKNNDQPPREAQEPQPQGNEPPQQAGRLPQQEARPVQQNNNRQRDDGRRSNEAPQPQGRPRLNNGQNGNRPVIPQPQRRGSVGTNNNRPAPAQNDGQQGPPRNNNRQGPPAGPGVGGLPGQQRGN